MLRITSMNNYQAFRWLWRFDNEAKWFWLKILLSPSGGNLIEEVKVNFADFGIRNTRKECMPVSSRSLK